MKTHSRVIEYDLVDSIFIFDACCMCVHVSVYLMYMWRTKKKKGYPLDGTRFRAETFLSVRIPGKTH